MDVEDEHFVFGAIAANESIAGAAMVLSVGKREADGTLVAVLSLDVFLETFQRTRFFQCRSSLQNFFVVKRSHPICRENSQGKG